MSFGALPASTGALSRAAMVQAKARLGKRRQKLEECEVGDFTYGRPRPPVRFKLGDKLFAASETWISNGFRAVPIIERIE
jgi:hypothetical protein